MSCAPALTSPEARQALDELDTLLALSADTPAGPLLRLSPALARGLSYYTGPIFEIISPDFSGSLGGGGRYDNLVGMFSGKQVPAVGFSLGLERILLLMENGRMFPDLQLRAQVMVCPLPDTPLAAVTGLTARLRQAGITVELYPEQAKTRPSAVHRRQSRYPLRPDHWPGRGRAADLQPQESGPPDSRTAWTRRA